MMRLVEIQLNCFQRRVVGDEEYRRRGLKVDVKEAPSYDSILIHFVHQRKVPVPVPAHSTAIEPLCKHCA